MERKLTVTVLAFGSSADALGWRSCEVEIGAGGTLGALVERLERDCPRMGEARGRLRYAVNQQYATPQTSLNAGDEVAVIPPVSGGARAAARLVRTPINPAALLAEVEDPAVGAIASFVGVVRYETDNGRGLRALEYTAYEEMALAEMEQLCSDACERHELHKALLVHRLGTLKIGEPSVAVAVSAPHRAAAFDGCRALIEGVKAGVPIFKKELWQNGEATWVDGV